MITQRRVFQAKPGAAAAVVTKMKEFQLIFEKQGGPPCRIYTDFYSGRTDRVAWEYDVDALGTLAKLDWEMTQSAEFQKAYENWYEGLKPLIEGATVELWGLEVQ